MNKSPEQKTKPKNPFFKGKHLKTESRDRGLSRNGVTNYSNGPCVTFLE